MEDLRFSMNELMPLVVAGVGAVYVFWKLLLRPYLETKKPFPHLAMAPQSHYLLGHLKLNSADDFDEAQKKLVKNRNELGRVGYWEGPKKAMAVTNWQDARAVLNAASWRDINPITRVQFNALMPHTILGMNGKEWKLHRAAINKSFTPKDLHAYTDVMIDVTETICASLQERVMKERSNEDGYYQTEVEKLMKMITMDVFGKSTFSRDFGCTKTLQPNEFAAAFDSIGETGLSGRKFIKVRSIIQGYVANLIKERMYEKEEEGTTSKEKKDLLTNIIEASTNQYGNVSSDEVLRDVIVTVLFAGYDTTSVTLTYALYMLSQNPDMVDKCLEEIGNVQSLRDFEDLVYCKAVITETLRLFPPAPQTSRSLKKPVKLPVDGFVIPAGTTVMIPIWSVHRNEMNFPRPLEFWPERWVSKAGNDDGTFHWVERDPNSDTASSPGSIPAGNPKALFAFSAGGRNCPGMKFAKQEAVVILAGLIKVFEFKSLPGYELSTKRDGAIQHPTDRMPMKIKLRSDTTSTK